MKTIINRKWIRGLAAALTLSLGLSGCAFEVNEADREDQHQLEGYWETVHLYEEETGTDSTGEPYSYTEDIDILPGDREHYMVLRFTEAYVTIIATYDPEVALLLDIPIPYTLEGRKIYSMLFVGEFADHMTVEELTEEKLVLRMDDEGTDEDGSYSDFMQLITFKRVG